jgi:hypothetical protein
MTRLDGTAGQAIGRAHLHAHRAAYAQRLVDLHLVPAFEQFIAPGDGRAAEIHARLAGGAGVRTHAEGRALDLDRVEHAGAVRDHHRHAVVFHRLAQGLMTDSEIIGVDAFDPGDAGRAADGLVIDLVRGITAQGLAGAGMILATGHGHRAIVEQQHGDVGLVVHGVDQRRYAAVQEGRITDGGDDRFALGAGQRHADRVADAGTHRHASIHGRQRLQGGEGVAADVAGHARIVTAQAMVAADVRTAGAQHGRAHQRRERRGRDRRACRQDAGRDQAFTDVFRRQFADAREEFLAVRGYAHGAHLGFDDRFELFDHEHPLDLRAEVTNGVACQGIGGGQLQHAGLGQHFLDIDIGHANGDDADLGAAHFAAREL